MTTLFLLISKPIITVLIGASLVHEIAGFIHAMVNDKNIML